MTDEHELNPVCPDCEHPLGVQVEFSTVESDGPDGALVAIWHYQQQLVPIIDTDELSGLAWDNATVTVYCSDCGWEHGVGATGWEHGTYRAEATA